MKRDIAFWVLLAVLVATTGCLNRGDDLVGPADPAAAGLVSPVLGGPSGEAGEPVDPSRIPEYHLGGGGGIRPIPRVPYRPGEVVVKLNAGESLALFNETFGTTTVEQLPDGFARLALAESDDDPWNPISEMDESGSCEHVEPNFVTEAPESQQGTLPIYEGDHVYGDVVTQDPLDQIGIPAAHAYATGSGVVVAVIDTGIDATHPDLAASISPVGYDFVDDDADPSEERPGVDVDGNGIPDQAAGHGTHVAGLILAVAPDVTIMAVRVLDSEGQGTSFNVARGIRWAAANGADIINLSLGMYADADVIKRAIQDVDDLDVVVVNAAGNRGRYDERHFPARMSRVISVAAIDEKDARAEFSNWGEHVHISAPGVAILSTGLDHGYAIWSGTSMSAPLVSGAAALRLQIDPAATPDDVADAIEDTRGPLDVAGTPWVNSMGGRLDCLALVGAR
ncbi:MAG: S8 family serine peptidase [Gemmatimonadetes bacterium]|nr:S8 family serine peptidase [Gemmatimonadota bacterium]